MAIVRQNNAAFSVEIEAWTTADGVRRTDITNATSGLEIRYWTDPNGAVTTLAPAAQTSTGAHTNGGIVHKYRGTYRVDVPAINSPGAVVSVTMGGLAGVEFSVARVQLVSFAPGSSQVELVDDAITTAKIQNGAFTSAKFASGAFDAVWSVATRSLTTFGTLATDVRNAILNWEPYTGYSLARLLRVMGITLRGTASGLNTTTATYTAPAGGATVTATVDADGNRSVVNDTASGTP